MVETISTEDVDLGKVEVRKLHAAIRAGDQGLVSDLLDRGARINAPCTAADSVIFLGEPLIHLAIAVGQAAMVQVLVAKGADRNAKNLLGNTPLVSAILGDRPDIAEALLNGTRIDWLGYIRQDAPPAGEGNDVDSTPLLLAAVKGRVEIVEMLIDHGMSVNLMPAFKIMQT